MAIKVQGTTVIDDSRDISNIGIATVGILSVGSYIYDANGVFGTTNQVLTSVPGIGVSWADESGGGSGGDKIEEGNTSAEVVDTGSNGHFKVTTEGIERLRIDSNGNLGVGITNPDDKLDVLFDTSAGNRHFFTKDGLGVRLQRRGDTVAWAMEYGFETNNGTDVGGFGAYGTNTGLNRYYIGSSYQDTKFVIESGGDVGIGTDNPQNKLDVRGDIRIQDSIPTILFRSPDGSSNQYYIGANISDSVNGGLIIGEGSGITGGTGRININSSGNVGIGTNVPSVKLHVHSGSVRTTNTAETNFTELGTDGNIELKRSGGGAYIDFADLTSDDFDVRIQESNDGLVFTTGGNGSTTEKVRITSNGYVGINSTAPTATLDVNGTLNVSGVSTFQGNVDLGDNDRLRLGDSQDLQIYHTGVDSFIRDLGTGNLYIDSNGASINIRTNFDESSIVANNNGSVDLYYDDSKKFETTGYGVTVSGGVYVSGVSTFQGDAYFGDNDRLRLGDGQDLQIYHGSLNSYIRDIGTGNLLIRSDGSGVRIQKDGGDNMGVFNTDGSVDLYYDNSKKFETTGIGVSIVGTGNTATITGPSNLVLDPAAVGDNTGTVTILGNLQVDGTQTIINSTTMTVDDLNITLASGAANASAANGAGLTVDGASATLTYSSTGDSWVFNKAPYYNSNRLLTTADEGTGNGLDADTLDGLEASQFLRSDADDQTTGQLTADTLLLTNDATNTSRHRVSVFDSGTTSYGMMLWNTNGTSGDWATMIYGPNQSNRRISFGKITGGSFVSHSDVTEFAHFDTDDYSLNITGQLISTKANSTSTGGGQLHLNGATGNRIDFNQNGVAAPAFTTRSAGTKLVLYPEISVSGADYALGIESGTLWYSIPQALNIRQHRWYAGTTQLADLKGTGELVIGSTSFTGTANQKLQVNSGAYVSGNLGIGVTNPDGKLHISSGTSGDCRVYIEADTDNNAEGDNAFIIFKLDGGIETSSVWAGNADGSNDNSLNLANSTSIGGGIRFFTNTTGGDWESAPERMRITTSGNIGINTTAPGSTLAVGGTITELYNGTYWNVVTQADVGYGASQVPLNQYLGQLAFLDDYHPNGLRRDGGGSDDAFVSSGGEVLVGSSSTTGTSNQKLQVTGGAYFSQAVGIGYTAPGFTLAVNGSGYFNTNLIGTNVLAGTQTLTGTSNQKLQVDGGAYVSGNLGIGNTNPTSKLHIFATTNGEEVLRIGGSHGNSGSIQGITHIGLGYWTSGTYSPARITVQELDNADHRANLLFSTRGADSDTAPTERMRISYDGNVGIGTDSPAAKLDVRGHIKVDNGPTLENGDNTELQITTDYGYVKVGPRNSVWSHFYTDRNKYYFDKPIAVDTGQISSYDDDISFFTDEFNDERVRILASNGYVGINTTTPSYQLHVNGSFAATTKSFVIDHPTKEGMKLRYGSLEGPENGVYVRGRLKDNNTIELPDHWTGLVDEETITVNLTPIGRKAPLHSVVDIVDNTVVVESANDVVDCFYTVFGERKDVEKLEVEF